MLALIDAHQKGSGPLGLDDLFRLGWPGESIGRFAAVSRVHAALHTLRKLGLEEYLVREGVGYALAGSPRE